MEVESVYVRCFVHATDNKKLVKKAIYNLFSRADHECDDKDIDRMPLIEIRSKSARGHFGNIIEVLEADIRDKALIKNFFLKLDHSVKQSSMIYNNKIILKLNKQSAFQGTISAGGKDTVYVRISLKRGRGDTVIDWDMIDI